MKINYDKLYELKPNWLPGDDVPDEARVYDTPRAPDAPPAETPLDQSLRDMFKGITNKRVGSTPSRGYAAEHAVGSLPQPRGQRDDEGAWRSVPYPEYVNDTDVTKEYVPAPEWSSEQKMDPVIHSASPEARTILDGLLRQRPTMRDLAKAESTPGTPVAPTKFMMPPERMSPREKADTFGLRYGSGSSILMEPGTARAATFRFDGEQVSGEEYHTRLQQARAYGMPRQTHYDADKREYRASGLATVFHDSPITDPDPPKGMPTERERTRAWRRNPDRRYDHMRPLSDVVVEEFAGVYDRQPDFYNEFDTATLNRIEGELRSLFFYEANKLSTPPKLPEPTLPKPAKTKKQPTTIHDLVVQIHTDTAAYEEGMVGLKSAMGGLADQLKSVFGAWGMIAPSPFLEPALREAAEQQDRAARDQAYARGLRSPTGDHALDAALAAFNGIDYPPFDLEEEIAKSKALFEESIVAANAFHPELEYTYVAYDEMSDLSEQDWNDIAKRTQKAMETVREANAEACVVPKQWLFDRPDQRNYPEEVMNESLLRIEPPAQKPRKLLPGSLRLTFASGMVEAEGDVYTTPDAEGEDGRAAESVQQYIMGRLMDTE